MVQLNEGMNTQESHALRVSFGTLQILLRVHDVTYDSTGWAWVLDLIELNFSSNKEHLVLVLMF